VLPHKRVVRLIVLLSFLALSTGSALALHLQTEGPEHRYAPDACPLCHQLSYGSVAPIDDGPSIIYLPEADVPFVHCEPAVEPTLQVQHLPFLALRAPPAH